MLARRTPRAVARSLCPPTLAPPGCPLDALADARTVRLPARCARQTLAPRGCPLDAPVRALPLPAPPGCPRDAFRWSTRSPHTLPGCPKNACGASPRCPHRSVARAMSSSRDDSTPWLPNAQLRPRCMLMTRLPVPRARNEPPSSCAAPGCPGAMLVVCSPRLRHSGCPS
jgi:hypothetical protein